MKFIGTRRIRMTRSGTSIDGEVHNTTILNIDKMWEFDKGDWVKVCVWETYPDAPKYITVRKLGRAGSSLRVTIPKAWGLPPGAWVYYTVESHPSIEGQTEEMLEELLAETPDEPLEELLKDDT